MGRATIEGWITLDAGEGALRHGGAGLRLAQGAGGDPRVQAGAARRARPSVTLKNTLRTIDSRNVVAKLEGSDPALKDEYVIYTAHWDHFGVGDPGRRRLHLQRRARQRQRARAALLDDRAGLQGAAHRAQALDPLPRRHRRGAGAARLAVLLGARRSIRSRRRWPTSTSTASTCGADARTWW